MSNRPSRVFLAVILVFGSIGVSMGQRTAPASDITARAVTAADAFLGTLDQGQRPKANLDLNAKTRTVWSNLPSGMPMQVGATERNGLKLADMTPVQEKAALALVAATLSRDGFQKAMAIVDADQVLETRSAPTRLRRREPASDEVSTYVSILGKPSTSDLWMIQFGGHHLAINVTLAGRQNVLTPTHTGTQPASYTVDGRTIRPLGDENDKAFALVNALSPTSRSRRFWATKFATSSWVPAPTARRSRQRASALRRSLLHSGRCSWTSCVSGWTFLATKPRLQR